jgi:hypothetical protein
MIDEKNMTSGLEGNMLESDTRIFTESLRYSSDIQAQALGDKFDIRRYHNAILGSGSMPYPILERHIGWFIQEELKIK